MVYNTFNIIDLILHINTHIIVLLAIFHILSNIRFKNTMMELSYDGIGPIAQKKGFISTAEKIPTVVM